MTDLHIGPASAADLGAVLDFWKAAAEGTSISDDLAGVERLHARDPQALLLALRDGELVGTVIAGFDGWRCHLYRLAVHPGHRRQGIAAALLAGGGGGVAARGGGRRGARVGDRHQPAPRGWGGGGGRGGRPPARPRAGPPARAHAAGRSSAGLL
ncbi:GNAT family N-acetyltransferase, partial [Streptomyces sp. NPDC059538]|uniref:GNAT family N-acetyltransferase n=1 Tax=Streptomyces sp. NPDC059538 TaxID=3346860 RepID=UPI00367EC5DE